MALQSGAMGDSNTFVLQHDVIDATSNVVLGSVTSAPFAVGSSARAGNHSVAQHIPLENAPLWSVETPHLYILRTRLLQSAFAPAPASAPPVGTPSAAPPLSAPAVDEVNVTFGIRRAVFDANTGFALNDEKLQIRGPFPSNPFPPFPPFLCTTCLNMLERTRLGAACPTQPPPSVSGC